MENVGVILAGVAMFLFIASLIGLVNLAWLKQTSRRKAFGKCLGASILIALLAGGCSYPPETPQTEEEAPAQTEEAAPQTEEEAPPTEPDEPQTEDDAPQSEEQAPETEEEASVGSTA